MLGYRNQPVVTAFSNVVLTSAYTGNSFIHAVGGMAKIAIDIKYARGAAEAASKMQFKVEHSADGGTNWYSLTIDSTTTISTITAREWEIGNTANLSVLLDIAYKQVRISVKESGVTTNAGTALVTLTDSGI